jgi:hypothetical protein
MKQRFGRALAQHVGKDVQIIESGLYLYPISNELIRQQINHFMHYLQIDEAYQLANQAWLKRIEERGTVDVIHDPQPIQPEWATIAGGIPALFSPDLLPGLAVYRKEVVTLLSANAARGERAWEDILRAVTFGEGHVPMTESYYPITLAQARAWYA